jgi:hypothetical protein
VPLPVSLSTIAGTEAALNVTFPAMFKTRMARSNGDCVSLDDETWFLYPFWDPTDPRTIRRTSQDIKHETREVLQANIGFPADGIAIAHNDAGDRLLLRRRGNVLGNEVWLFRLHGGELHQVLDDVAALWNE